MARSEQIMGIAYIEITAACNFRCSFCPLISMDRPMHTMSREMVLDLIDQVQRDRLADRMSFHVMGEPTLHKDVALFCRVATKANLKVTLVTNGSRLSPELSDALLDTGLRKIELSLRSPNDEYYSEIFKASKRLDYESYLGQIRSLLENSFRRGPDHPTTITIRVFQESFSDVIREKVKYQDALYDTKTLLETLKSWGMEICGMRPGELRQEFPQRFAEKALKPLTPNAAIRTSHIMRWWQLEADQVNTKYPAMVSYCSGFDDMFAVLADGRVSACCLDYEGRTALGNAKEKPLKEILTGTEVSEFVRSFRRLRPPTETCSKCLGGNTIPEWAARQVLAVGRRITGRRLL